MSELAVKATEYLRRALQLNPSLVQAHAWLGAALVMLGRIDEAIDAMQEALRLEPNNANAHMSLGRAYWMGKGDVPGGIRHLREAITLNSEGGYAYLQLSFLESINGELDAAAESARNAIVLQERAISGTEGLLIVGGHARLGYVHYLRGRYDEAYAEYRKELEFLATTDHALRDRTLIELHQKLGAVQAARGERQDAERFGDLSIQGLQNRLAAGADDPATRYYVAAVYAQRGDVENTVTHLKVPLTRLKAFTRWRLPRDPDFAPVRDNAAVGALLE
jgi:tetratricopeptide (TPR) repeat protein